MATFGAFFPYATEYQQVKSLIQFYFTKKIDEHWLYIRFNQDFEVQ